MTKHVSFLEKNISSEFFPTPDQDCSEKQLHQNTLSLIKLLNKLSSHFITLSAEAIDKMKPELIKIALQVCEKFLKKELENPQKLQLLLESILEDFSVKRKKNPIKVLLSTQDFQTFTRWTEKHGILEGLQSINFASDPLLPNGAFKIDLEHQWIYHNLTEELENLLALLSS